VPLFSFSGGDSVETCHYLIRSLKSDEKVENSPPYFLSFRCLLQVQKKEHQKEENVDSNYPNS